MKKFTIIFRVSLAFGFSVCLATFPFIGNADDYSSSNFRIRDPGLTSGGGEISSTNFRLQGAIGQVLVGTSSASNFQLCIGVFCFPAPTPPPSPPPAPPAPVGGGGIIETILRIIGLPTRVPLPVLPIPIPPRPAGCPYPPTDLNCDGIIGVQDLSILLYLLPQPGPNPADFNRDQAVNTYDFSIMFSDWNERLFTFIPEAQSRVIVREATVPNARPGFAFVGEQLLQPSSIPAEEDTGEGGVSVPSGFGPKIISILKTGWDVMAWILDRIGGFFRDIW